MSDTDLLYAGEGRFLPGIPADTLTADAIKALAERRSTTPAHLRKELLESGLYREDKPAKPDKET
jgi:hypothetical protein